MNAGEEKARPSLKAKLSVGLLTIVVFTAIGWFMSDFLDVEDSFAGAAGGAIGFYLLYLRQNR